MPRCCSVRARKAGTAAAGPGRVSRESTVDRSAHGPFRPVRDAATIGEGGTRPAGRSLRMTSDATPEGISAGSAEGAWPERRPDPGIGGRPRRGAGFEPFARSGSSPGSPRSGWRSGASSPRPGVTRSPFGVSSH